MTKKRTKTQLREATPKEWDDMTFVCPEDSTRGNTKKAVERTDDDVQNPIHYNQGNFECIEGIEAMLTPQEYIGYLRGNSLKYRWRYPYKNGIQDIIKAEYYEKKLMRQLDMYPENYQVEPTK